MTGASGPSGSNEALSSLGCSDSPLQVFPFIVGAERSGTTLLQSMLNCHPRLAIPPESHFVVPFADRREWYEHGGFDPERFLSDLCNDKWFPRWGLDVEEVAARLGSADSLEGAIRIVFATYAASRDKPLYGDKTPAYVGFLPLVSRMFPEARVVHIIRDGRDAALSLAEMPFGPGSPEEALRKWSDSVRSARLAGRRLGCARYFEIRYERLVAQPERALREVCRFLNLDYSPTMLDYHLEPAHNRPERGTDQFHPGLQRPPTTGLRNWRSAMPPSQQLRCEWIAGDLLRACGYEPAPMVRGLRFTVATAILARYRALRARAGILKRWLRVRRAKWVRSCAAVHWHSR